ncbi:MAG TPA: hypothetical protein VFU86_18735 [Terriglobales bacterium]|nr:hypothetical protein [Terriglobales bacterium]
MTIPKREGEFETGPPRRPSGPGEPEERTDTGAIRYGKNWKRRFPGWETYEGRPHDPRFEHDEDPSHDIRYDTNLNPSFVIPRRLNLVVYVLGAVLGFLLLVGVGLLLFFHFMQPASRSPQGPQGAAHSISTSLASAIVAPNICRPTVRALPL